MKLYLRYTLGLILILTASAGLFAQAEVSERQELAIFSLGFYGHNIPADALGTIDIEMQRVFLDLGRFTIMGMTQRFDSGSVNDFIDAIKRSKEANFVMPEKFMFGEAFFTDAEFNKLVGAFIIAVPVVTYFNSQWVNNREWKTDIKTNITFINVLDGTMMGISNVETSGTSRETQFKSIKSAIDSIPMQLQYEIRSIPAFQLRTRVLASKGWNVELQLGSAMGIKKGDEYSLMESVSFGDFVDEREAGLILIKDVRTNSSTGTILYSSTKIGADAQLQEIPRLGVDFSPYLHGMSYFSFIPQTNDFALAVGARAQMTRGFYNVRPFIIMEVLLDINKWFPINILGGAQYSIYLRRLEIGARAGGGVSANIVINILQDLYSRDDDVWFTHYGVTAGAFASYLVNRNTKVFAEAQADYFIGRMPLLGEPFRDFGGLRVGLGVTFKQ